MQLPMRNVDKRLLRKVEKTRQNIHKHPETGYQEKRTAALVARTLRAIGYREVQTGVGGTGVVAVLRGAHKGRTVALRADMDALPITEETRKPYASARKGFMHACGHDGHTAVLLGTAELLWGLRSEIAGNVKFLFQPAEEGGAGGRAMFQAGVLKNPNVDAIFSLHGGNQIKPGQIQVVLTPNVAAYGFVMKIRGKSGHGAWPQVCVDPIMIGAHIITAAQTIVSREKGPSEPGVLSFCAFNGGTKSNIIPDEATILGTIRTADMATLKRMQRSLERVAQGVARSLRGSVTITDEMTFPPVFNNPKLVEFVRGVGAELLGAKNVFGFDKQEMGGEDFSFFLEDQGGVPGVMFRLGVGGDYGLHTPRFDFGFAPLKPGILMLSNIALRYLVNRR